MSLLFDITSYEQSLKFLTDYLTVEPKRVIAYVEESNKDDYDVDDFIETFKISLDELEIENIDAAVFHVTSNNDNCNSIKMTGLLNLQQALTMNTPLKKYLRNFRIEFDVSNKIMWVKGKQFDITYNSSSWPSNEREERLENVARKVYFDHQINGFFCIQDFRGYGGEVHKRPEILFNLQELFQANILVERWENSCKPYVVKYRAPLDYFTYYTFYDEKYEYEDDYKEKAKLKTWLINKALYVIWDWLHYNEIPEFYAYMKPEISIPFSDILEIYPLGEFER